MSTCPRASTSRQTSHADRRGEQHSPDTGEVAKDELTDEPENCGDEKGDLADADDARHEPVRNGIEKVAEVDRELSAVGALQRHIHAADEHGKRPEKPDRGDRRSHIRRLSWLGHHERWSLCGGSMRVGTNPGESMPDRHRVTSMPCESVLSATAPTAAWMFLGTNNVHESLRTSLAARRCRVISCDRSRHAALAAPRRVVFVRIVTQVSAIGLRADAARCGITAVDQSGDAIGRVLRVGVPTRRRSES